MPLEVGQDVWVNGVKGVIMDTYRPIGTYREFKIFLVTGQTIARTRMQIDTEDPFECEEWELDKTLLQLDSDTQGKLVLLSYINSGTPILRPLINDKLWSEARGGLL